MEQSVLIAVKSGLFLIETCLRDILQATKAGSESGNWLLKEQRPDIDDTTANELADKAREMLEEIQKLQDTFDIEKDVESPRWHVVNDLNQIWSTLSELSEERLRGYGQIQPQESRLLATHVARMMAIRKEMEKIASGQ